ncbi:hypothetical protein [Rufibacter quisquiliarum]|uniref:Uncharacterized protein n=1 Tax=Rufibacter quisquiliarum TaxID=1549639 RepID=A0A839GU65_9BACT|nr:hypothetical protein [Rufibacter quisquiliarum]MBA9078336.1 hypothetical protein [Rufibacter quisquiliarum]
MAELTKEEVKAALLAQLRSAHSEKTTAKEGTIEEQQFYAGAIWYLVGLANLLGIDIQPGRERRPAVSGLIQQQFYSNGGCRYCWFVVFGHSFWLCNDSRFTSVGSPKTIASFRVKSLKPQTLK